jgi:Na+/melibiose symporter-like transporter
MKQTPRQVVLVVSAVLMVALALVTIFAMVIAPPCTGIMQKANLYKIISLCVFLGAYYLLAWRHRSMTAAMFLPALQIVSGLLFTSYLNSLPIGCPA